MRVLVIGGGAREHAILWKLAQSDRVGKLWCAPGNAGTAELAENISLAGDDIDGILSAVEGIAPDLVVIGPEAPLARGLADRLAERGVRVCGPTSGAAQIETSKAWAKTVMREAGVPTARSVVVTDLMVGLAELASFGLPVVVKADGLAAGKGVVVATSRDEAVAALTAFLKDAVLGAAGRTVLIEECLVGDEVSVLVLTDGKRVCLLPPARDHKRAHDGDRGQNTGGMGAFAPVPSISTAELDEIGRSVMEPVVRRLAERGEPFRGVLYGGLMMTPGGPMVLEFNARFGDPEAQAILPILDGDLIALLLAGVGDGILPERVRANGSAVAVAVAAGGYPGPFERGLPISGLEHVPDDVLVFHAGTRRDEHGRLVTAGGRVLTVVGRGNDLETARGRAYAGVEAISFPRMHVRGDIGRSSKL